MEQYLSRLLNELILFLISLPPSLPLVHCVPHNVT